MGRQQQPIPAKDGLFILRDQWDGGKSRYPFLSRMRLLRGVWLITPPREKVGPVIPLSLPNTGFNREQGAAAVYPG